MKTKKNEINEIFELFYCIESLPDCPPFSILKMGYDVIKSKYKQTQDRFLALSLAKIILSDIQNDKWIEERFKKEILESFLNYLSFLQIVEEELKEKERTIADIAKENYISVNTLYQKRRRSGLTTKEFINKLQEENNKKVEFLCNLKSENFQ